MAGNREKAMKKVLIVDDDTIVRITLRSMIDWEKHGYEIVADASHGEQALRFLKEHPVDLLITDMKMPIMDGIQLMKCLQEQQKMPCTVVLSSYDDFSMVRESFRLGASDYLLKADISEEMLEGLLVKLNLEGEKEEAKQEETWSREADGNQAGDNQTGDNQAGNHLTRERLLAAMAMGRKPLEPEFFTTDYYIVQFEIDDFFQQAPRFGHDIETALVKPMMEFAKQIPRVAARCVLGSISPSRYLMYYQVSAQAQAQDNVVSTCRQLSQVWNNYMNIPVSAGISGLGKGEKDFFACFEEAGEQLELHYLKGKSNICYPWEKNRVMPKEVRAAKERYAGLLQGLKASDEMQAERGKQKLLHRLQTMDVEEGKRECLAVILIVIKGLQDTYENIWTLFQEDIDYYNKLERLDQMRSLEIWMNNYFRWVMDYLAKTCDDKQADVILRSKRFIQDNYSNPELSLGSVAGYVGLNEKYFSSRFTKETGSTFSNYLTEVRIRKAKELMDKTDLKMYEISLNVGYNSVEHFTRVFKKVCQISPSAYKKSET